MIFLLGIATIQPCSHLAVGQLLIERLLASLIISNANFQLFIIYLRVIACCALERHCLLTVKVAPILWFATQLVITLAVRFLLVIEKCYILQTLVQILVLKVSWRLFLGSLALLLRYPTFPLLWVDLFLPQGRLCLWLKVIDHSRVAYSLLEVQNWPCQLKPYAAWATLRYLCLDCGVFLTILGFHRQC